MPAGCSSINEAIQSSSYIYQDYSDIYDCPWWYFVDEEISKEEYVERFVSK